MTAIGVFLFFGGIRSPFNPRGYPQYNRQPALVLENPGGEPLNRLIQGPMEMRQFLRLAISLASALSRLHKRELPQGPKAHPVVFSFNVDHGGGNVTESAKSMNDLPVEASIPEGAVSLDSILFTEELQRRPSRPPDYEKENRALVALMSTLTDSPNTVFQTLADTILDITQCDSAGLSLLTRDGKKPDVCGKRFYWPAIAGMWNPHVGGGTPRNFGPCGDVLDQNRTLLFRHFERRYPYLLPVIPAAEECLLVPFYVAGEAVGTIWAIMHSDRRKFDAEDDRLMASLGKFASSAYQALIYIEDLEFQVSEREKAEAEVRELAEGLEAKIRRLVEANVVGIVMWNLEGAITGANEAFLCMVQYNREDLASGRVRWTNLTPAEWRGHDERAVADLKATGIFQPFEREYFRKDGSRVPVLLGGALIEGSGNEGVAFVLDLSEQKRAQENLRESETRLQAFQEDLGRVTRVVAMGELAATIAHEVNQPLTAIVTNGSFCLRRLKSATPDLDEFRAAVTEIVNDGERASAVISRIRGLLIKGVPTRTELEINQIIQDVTILLRHEFTRSHVSLRTELASDLPRVPGDPVQLQQVLINLIMNAIEATSSSRNGRWTILIRSAENPDGVLVQVQDSGPGIAPELADRIFEPFFTTKTEGIGMGLSISHSIIESHGGRLGIVPSSTGALFEFTLPTDDAGAS
jgi:PAS domain S-box-containing protein